MIGVGILDDDDEPVLESPRVCGECRRSGAETPLIPDGSGFICDDCDFRRKEFALKHCGEPVDGEEIFIEYSVRVGVRVKNRSPTELILARLRALEVLLGMPMAQDEESWEHMLIAMVDEEGNEISEPESPSGD